MADSHHKQTIDCLKAGKFSDLTLTCNDKTFPVHKALVCVHSNVLAESLFGTAAAAEQTKITNMDRFVPDTVQAFVDFVYDGDYIAVKSESRKDDDDDGNNNDNDNDHDNDNGSDDNDNNQGIVPELLNHVRAHHFACEYKVAKMEEIASSKLKTLLAKHRGEETLISSLPAAIEAAHALESSLDLMDILAASAAKDVTRLQDKGSFATFAGMAQFLLLVIKHCALNAEAQTQAMKKKEVDNGKASTALKLMRQQDSCDNALCQTKFSATITDEFDLSCRTCKKKQAVKPADPKQQDNAEKSSFGGLFSSPSPANQKPTPPFASTPTNPAAQVPIIFGACSNQSKGSTFVGQRAF